LNENVLDALHNINLEFSILPAKTARGLLLPLIPKLFGYDIWTGEKNGFDGRQNFGRKIVPF
jgi:hypothetical protein